MFRQSELKSNKTRAQAVGISRPPHLSRLGGRKTNPNIFVRHPLTAVTRMGLKDTMSHVPMHCLSPLDTDTELLDKQRVSSVGDALYCCIIYRHWTPTPSC